MNDRTNAWNDMRRSLERLVSAVRSEIAAQAPRAADELAAAAPRVREQVSDRISAAVPQLVDGLWAAAPFLVRRTRKPAMAAGPLGLLCAFAGGALLAHFCDPQRGPERRRAGTERIGTALRFGAAQAERVARRVGPPEWSADARASAGGPAPS